MANENKTIYLNGNEKTFTIFDTPIASNRYSNGVSKKLKRQIIIHFTAGDGTAVSVRNDWQNRQPHQTVSADFKTAVTKGPPSGSQSVNWQGYKWNADQDKYVQQTIEAWEGHISTPYIVNRDDDEGKNEIHKLYDPDCFSISSGTGWRRETNYQIIAVEFINFGPLIKVGNILNNIYNQNRHTIDEVEKYIKYTFRDYHYYETYDSKQYDSIILLLKYLCREYHIPAEFIKEKKQLFRNFPDGSNLSSSEQARRKKELAEFKGIYSHQNIQNNKVDVGPGFHWNLVFRGISNRWWPPTEISQLPRNYIINPGKEKPYGNITEKTHLKMEDTKNYYSPTHISKHYNLNSKYEEGSYPIGKNNLWHGGIHLYPDSPYKSNGLPHSISSSDMTSNILTHLENGNYLDEKSLIENSFQLVDSTYKLKFDQDNHKKSQIRRILDEKTDFLTCMHKIYAVASGTVVAARLPIEEQLDIPVSLISNKLIKITEIITNEDDRTFFEEAYKFNKLDWRQYAYINKFTLDPNLSENDKTRLKKILINSGFLDSTRFILIRHKVFINFKNDRLILDYDQDPKTFYSLYMHTGPPTELKNYLETDTPHIDNPKWLNTYLKEEGINLNGIKNGQIFFPDAEVSLGDHIGLIGKNNGRDSIHFEVFSNDEVSEFCWSQADHRFEDTDADAICNPEIIKEVNNFVLTRENLERSKGDIKARFRSEWSIKNPDDFGPLLDGYMESDKEAFKNKLEKFEFWEAVQQQFDSSEIEDSNKLPADGLVWHYHPFRFIEVINAAIDLDAQHLSDEEERFNTVTLDSNGFITGFQRYNQTSQQTETASINKENAEDIVYNPRDIILTRQTQLSQSNNVYDDAALRDYTSDTETNWIILNQTHTLCTQCVEQANNSMAFNSTKYLFLIHKILQIAILSVKKTKPSESIGIVQSNVCNTHFDDILCKENYRRRAIHKDGLAIDIKPTEHANYASRWLYLYNGLKKAISEVSQESEYDFEIKFPLIEKFKNHTNGQWQTVTNTLTTAEKNYLPQMKIHVGVLFQHDNSTLNNIVLTDKTDVEPNSSWIELNLSRFTQLTYEETGKNTAEHKVLISLSDCEHDFNRLINFPITVNKNGIKNIECIDDLDSVTLEILLEPDAQYECEEINLEEADDFKVIIKVKENGGDS